MGRTRARLACAAAVVVLASGCGGSTDDPGVSTGSTSGADSSTGTEAPESPTASESSSPQGGSTPATRRSVPGPKGAAATPVPVAPGLKPRRISIPAIGVDAPTITLGIRRDGAIEVPDNARDSGWLTSSAAPGEQGPAVLAGHVDSTEGPAVFYDLRELTPGDAITITRRDGSTVDFTVDGVETYPQDAFPTATVYGPVPGPVLRLITCGGAFVRDQGGYQDNVVVYAS